LLPIEILFGIVRRCPGTDCWMHDPHLDFYYYIEMCRKIYTKTINLQILMVEKMNSFHHITEFPIEMVVIPFSIQYKMTKKIY
jgi:hypothetical protein